MWELLDRKDVRDFDGFWTEYSIYSDGERFVCVFGDSDIYGPEDEANWDFDTESVVEAREWFTNYEGCEDEDEDYMPSREDYLEWCAASCGMDYFSYVQAF